MTVADDLIEMRRVGVRHDTVGLSMQDDRRSLILAGRLIDRQLLRDPDVFPAHFPAAEKLDKLRDVPSVIGFSHQLTFQSIIPQHSRRSQQRQRFHLFRAQLSGRHDRDHSSLGMSAQGDFFDIGKTVDLFINFLGILYFIEHGHILEIALALSVSIEIEPDAGDPLGLQIIRDHFQ